MAARREKGSRLAFQEQMEIVKLPPSTAAKQSAQDGEGEVRRYMGKRAAWLPGAGDIPATGFYGRGKPMPRAHTAAYGGHVYSQSALAVCRAWREEEDRRGVKEEERLGLHVGSSSASRKLGEERPSTRPAFEIPGCSMSCWLMAQESAVASGLSSRTCFKAMF